MKFVLLASLTLIACTQEDLKNSVTESLRAGCREMHDCTVKDDPTYPVLNQ